MMRLMKDLSLPEKFEALSMVSVTYLIVLARGANMSKISSTLLMAVTAPTALSVKQATASQNNAQIPYILTPILLVIKAN